MKLQHTIWYAALVLAVSILSCEKSVEPVIYYGSIEITSEPSGASIHLDNKLVGTTPDTLSQIVTGEHILVITSVGFSTQTDTVTVTKNALTEKHYVLLKRIGALAITSAPSGASIWLDSVSTGLVTPAVIDSLLGENNYLLTLKLDGYHDYGKIVWVKSFDTVEVHIDLSQGRGALDISSIPSGAGIYLDGNFMGPSTPFILTNQTPGQHQLMLRLNNYHDWEQSVEVIAFDTVSVSADLVIKTGTIVVNSTPSGADIWLDSVNTGLTTSATFTDIAIGSHTVELLLYGYRPYKKSFTLASDATYTVNATLSLICPGGIIGDITLPPEIHILNTHINDRTIYGTANNVDASKIKVVLWALTNHWYVQPFITSPYTTICGDGSWSRYTHRWKRMVALLVDSTYVPGSTRALHPAFETGVLAWDQFPPARPDLPLNFSGYLWGMKVAEDRFGPGPNYFSDDPENIWLDGSGLHMKIVYRDGKWTCPELYLLESLGFGTYTFQLVSRVDSLDYQEVFAGFTYESATREIDIEFSRVLAKPNNMQYVVQPYNLAGNLTRFMMPSAITSTHQFEWRPDHIQFTSWRGLDPVPHPDSLIQSWNYTGPSIPPANVERFRFNLWLFGGKAPISGIGDEVVIKSFDYQP